MNSLQTGLSRMLGSGWVEHIGSKKVKELQRVYFSMAGSVSPDDLFAAAESLPSFRGRDQFERRFMFDGETNGSSIAIEFPGFHQGSSGAPFTEGTTQVCTHGLVFDEEIDALAAQFQEALAKRKQH